MKIRFTFILLLLCSLIVAQRPDSLWQGFNNESFSDSLRLTHLHSLVRLYLYNNPDTSLHFSRIEQEFAQRVQDTSWIAAALNVQGIALTVKSDFLGALDRFIRMRDLRVAIRDTLGIAGAYNNIGSIYFHKGDYPRSLENFIRSLEFEERKGSKRGIAISLINIGSIYAQQDDFIHALDYFKRSLSLYEILQDTNGMASCYTNLGNVYKSLDSLDKSREYYERSIPLFKTTGDDMGLGVTYANVADVYRILGDNTRMFDYFRYSEDVRNQIGDKMGLARLYVSRGMALHHMDRHTEGRDECLQGLMVAEAVETMSEMKDACECLYVTNKALGRTEIALTYYERMNSLTDSLSKDETQRQLQLMEFRKQVTQDSIAREEERLAIASKHDRAIRRGSRQRNIFFISGVVLLAVSIISYRFMRQARKSRAQMEAEKSRTDKLLLSVLPASVATELLEKGIVDAREFQNVTVLFTDFIGFTGASRDMEPQELVNELNEIFRKFDEIIARHDVEKIKSIGDAYMAAGGLPVYTPETVKNTVLAALEMQSFVEKHYTERKAAGLPGFHMRVGLHRGRVIAGIVGFRNFQYDIWGDTVNLASRIESSGTEGRVNISQAVYEHIASDPAFHFEARGAIEVKGREATEMWFVEKK